MKFQITEKEFSKIQKANGKSLKNWKQVTQETQEVTTQQVTTTDATDYLKKIELLQEELQKKELQVQKTILENDIKTMQKFKQYERYKIELENYKRHDTTYVKELSRQLSLKFWLGTFASSFIVTMFYLLIFR